MDSGPIKYMPEPPRSEPLSAPDPAGQKLVILSVAIIAVIVWGVYARFVSPPPNFPVDTVENIQSGATLSGTASLLFSSGVIRSPFFFKSLVVLFGGSRGVHAGDYYFKSSQSALRVAWRLTHSMYDLENVRVTIPEGLDNRQVAALVAKQKKLTHFDSKEFLKIAAPYEGYLFPDTYLFLPNVSARDVMDAMLANYKKRISSVSDDIAAFGKPIGQVITMASILEQEGRTSSTREMIAGILWKRLDRGMPLQVDATIVYATGKDNGNKLTSDDFAVDSPYNTYTHKGLPPTPISNPGLDSIRAAVHPTASKYLYYLTDPEGGFHPAATNAEQEANRVRYLGY